MKNYFTDAETLCPCGCGAKPDKDMLHKMNLIREEFGKPIYVEQMATCSNYSLNLGREPTSTHISTDTKKSTAADIKSKTFKDKADQLRFESIAIKHGFLSIGRGSFWVGSGNNKRLHIDRRVGKTWMYE